MKTYDDIQTVTRYLTPDGEQFSELPWAKEHIDRINLILKTDEILDSGGSVADCCRVLGHIEIDPLLERLTQSSKLVIEHWQCRETPGYQVRNFNTAGKIYVSGDAGSWSGPYGSWVTLPDLIRYASDKRSKL